MFKDNRYTRIYYKIIEKAKSSNQEGYVERHHIVPKSFFKLIDPIQGWIDGNPDQDDNLVYLTAKEHILCHILLTRMVTGFIANTKVNSALTTFLGAEKRTGRKLTLKEAGRAREAAMVARKGVVIITNGSETKTISPETQIPQGWSFGQGYLLYNNGSIQITLYPDEEVPSGFIRGGLCGWNWYKNDDGDNLQIWEGNKIPTGYYPGKFDVISRQNSRHITNDIINKILLDGEDLPTGFRYGVVGGQVGTRDWYWITNGIENIQQKINEDIPVGFQPGRANTGGWYTDGIETKFFKSGEEIPENFKVGIAVGNGTGTKWFNNGIKHKRIKLGDVIPPGFVEGKMKAKSKEKIWYTNGKINIRLSPSDNIPYGFKPGKIPRNNKGLRWYTNGTEKRRFKEGNQLEGFILIQQTKNT